MSAKVKPSRVAREAANEIMQWKDDEFFLKFPHRQRRILKKDRLRITRIVDAVRTADLEAIKALYQ